MDRIEDSYITDEMLAAYLDGNATDDECRLIESSVGSDGLVSEIMSVFGIDGDVLESDIHDFETDSLMAEEDIIMDVEHDLDDTMSDYDGCTTLQEDDLSVQEEFMDVN